MAEFNTIADEYDKLWSLGPDYKNTVLRFIEQELALEPRDVLADLGGGTGHTAACLAARFSLETPPMCVEPSSKMLMAGLAAGRKFTPIQATAEAFMAMPEAKLATVFLIKEAIHKIADRGGFWKSMAKLPRPRALVVTRPQVPGFPFPKSVRDRFAAGQPSEDTMSAEIRESGLSCRVAYHDVRVQMPLEQWFALLRHRFVSDMFAMTDEAIETGIDEIEPILSDPLVFHDRLVFIDVCRSSEC